MEMSDPTSLDIAFVVAATTTASSRTMQVDQDIGTCRPSNVDAVVTIANAFRTLVECETQRLPEPSTASRLVTVARLFEVAVLGPCGVRFDTNRAHYSMDTMGVAEDDVRDLSKVLVTLLNVLPSSSVNELLAAATRNQERTVHSTSDFFQVILRRILLFHVVFEHWSIANSWEPLAINDPDDNGTMSHRNVWNWMFETCRRSSSARSHDNIAPVLDTMATIEAFVNSCLNRKSEREGGQVTTATKALSFAASAADDPMDEPPSSSDEDEVDDEDEEELATLEITAASRKRKRDSSPPLPPGVEARQGAAPEPVLPLVPPTAPKVAAAGGGWNEDEDDPTEEGGEATHGSGDDTMGDDDDDEDIGRSARESGGEEDEHEGQGHGEVEGGDGSGNGGDEPGSGEGTNVVRLEGAPRAPAHRRLWAASYRQAAQLLEDSPDGSVVDELKIANSRPLPMDGHFDNTNNDDDNAVKGNDGNADQRDAFRRFVRKLGGEGGHCDIRKIVFIGVRWHGLPAAELDDLFRTVLPTHPTLRAIRFVGFNWDNWDERYVPSQWVRVLADSFSTENNTPLATLSWDGGRIDREAAQAIACMVRRGVPLTCLEVKPDDDGGLEAEDAMRICRAVERHGHVRTLFLRVKEVLRDTLDGALGPSSPIRYLDIESDSRLSDEVVRRVAWHLRTNVRLDSLGLRECLITGEVFNPGRLQPLLDTLRSHNFTLQYLALARPLPFWSDEVALKMTLLLCRNCRIARALENLEVVVAAANADNNGMVTPVAQQYHVTTAGLWPLALALTGAVPTLLYRLLRRGALKDVCNHARVERVQEQLLQLQPVPQPPAVVVAGNEDDVAGGLHGRAVEHGEGVGNVTPQNFVVPALLDDKPRATG